jgi:hypothetical protein
MAELVIRCDNCLALARVPDHALGQAALCPACGAAFNVAGALAAIARPSATEPPMVYPVGHGERSEPAAGLLYGLALAPFALPLVWLLLPLLGVPAPVFTIGLPMAIAFGAAGLGLGVTFASWRFATRVKVLGSIVLLAWLLGAVFFSLKAQWVEAVRRDLGIAPGVWTTVRAHDGLYKVDMPAFPRSTNIEMIDGWALPGYRCADPRDRTFAFAVAHGKPPGKLRTEAQFFEEAKAGALATSNGTLLSERALSHQNQVGREYVFRLADQATNRTLRVYRVGSGAVIAVAEGAFLPPDARDVRRFFDSLLLFPGK